MVALVTDYNRALHAMALDAMFRDRKRIFVDRLKWDVPVIDGVYERDQYDTDRALYLVDSDLRDGRHLGSVRLTPTTDPHMLADIFPQLAEEGPPRRDDTWEITRLCTAPHLDAAAALKVRRRLAQALVETALLYGVVRYVLVARVEALSGFIATGWETRPLGLPQSVNGETVGALEILISPAALQTLRHKYGTSGPVLSFDAQVAA